MPKPRCTGCGYETSTAPVAPCPSKISGEGATPHYHVMCGACCDYAKKTVRCPLRWTDADRVIIALGGYHIYSETDVIPK